MIPVLVAADVKRQDAEAQARGIAVDSLMRAAGTAVARQAIAMLGGAYGRRIVVVCGKGNNGGDGLVAARVLRDRGAAVTVVLAAEHASEGASARALAAYAGRVADATELGAELARGALAIDAVLGVGLSRAPEGSVASAIRALASASCPVLSVDVPSGVDADTGAIPGVSVSATVTVTLGGYKPGLLFAGGAVRAGEVRVADIGMPAELRAGSAVAYEASDVAARLPVRTVDANKYRTGAAMLVCGSRAMPGAAMLAAGACVRAGAGLVMLASHPSVCAIAVGATPEIVTVPLGDSPEGVVDAKDVEQIAERLDRVRALVVGPGLTRHPATVEAIRALVSRTTATLVLDADGLNAFEGDAGALASRAGAKVLTPHEGEFARLTGEPVVDRIAQARGLAERTGCVVLLKGAGTVIASPAGRVAVNTTGTAALASAGTGDVLSGIVAAFVARGLDVFDAAACATYVHGGAARDAGGAPSASDVMAAVPGVLRALERA